MSKEPSEEAKAAAQEIHTIYRGAISDFGLEAREGSGDNTKRLLTERIQVAIDKALASQSEELRQWKEFSAPYAETPTGLKTELEELEAQVAEERRQFKNFHRLLCERFNCAHDEIDWKRDQVSVIEFIAKQVAALTLDKELFDRFYSVWVECESTRGCYSCCPEHDCRCPKCGQVRDETCNCGRDKINALENQILERQNAAKAKP